MTSLVKTTLVVALIVALLITSWQGGRIGVGAVYKLLAEWELQSGSVVTAESYSQALYYLHMAQRIDPKNPSIQLALAHINLRDPRRAIGESQQAALIHYRRALEVQPHRALSWAETFVIKTKLKEFDDEWQSAITNAVTLGAWEPKVQYLVAEAGTRSWLVMTPKTREMVVDMAIRGLVIASQWRTNQIQSLLKDRQFHTLVCTELVRRGKYSSFCGDL